MTTLVKISEQCKLLAAGHYQTGQGPELAEIKLLTAQVINSLFKLEKISQIATEGDFNPSGLMIATYDNIEVQPYKDRSMATLPVYPISLPRGMGVWYVSPSDDLDNFFVPLISGMAGIVKTQSILNNYENRIAYELRGNALIFTVNLLDLQTPVKTIQAQELVSDVSALDDYDPLPIPPDMEEPVIEGVLKLLGVRKPTEQVNNPKDHG